MLVSFIDICQNIRFWQKRGHWLMDFMRGSSYDSLHIVSHQIFITVNSSCGGKYLLLLGYGEIPKSFLLLLGPGWGDPRLSSVGLLVSDAVL
jgi:hypothetical protein